MDLKTDDSELIFNTISFVLIEPLYSGNIGSAARVIKNFGFSNLVLVNPKEITKEAYNMASHAYDILKNAKIYNSINHVIKEYDIVIGTSGIKTNNECNYTRNPKYSPKSIVKIIEKIGYKKKIAILFGRENIGLKNEELKLCTLICSIPTNVSYPILNLAQSVGIIAYEITKINKIIKYESISKKENIIILEKIKNLLLDINYKEEKIQNILILFKRIIGRTKLTKCEYNILMGLIRKIEYPIRKYNNIHCPIVEKNIKNIFNDRENKELLNITILEKNGDNEYNHRL